MRNLILRGKDGTGKAGEVSAVGGLPMRGQGARNIDRYLLLVNPLISVANVSGFNFVIQLMQYLCMQQNGKFKYN